MSFANKCCEQQKNVKLLNWVKDAQNIKRLLDQSTKSKRLKITNKNKEVNYV